VKTCTGFKEINQIKTMLQKIEAMVRRAKEIAETIRYADSVRIISHYDADGISSAAIMVRALKRMNKRFHLTFVNQLDEDNIKKFSKEDYNIVLFLDLGSGQLDAIQKHFNDRTLIVSDHHQIQGGIGKNMLHLNPVDFDIEDNISGSGVTYLIARSLGEENRDLSEFAIIGAIGDTQTGSIGNSWGVMGLNKEILKDAVVTKKLKVDKGLRIYGRYTRPIHKALEYSVDPYIPDISGSESKSVQFLKDIGIELKGEKGRWRSLADLSDEEQKKLASHIIVERMKGNVENPDWIFGDVYELLEKKDYRDANEFATVLNAFSKMGMSYLGLCLCLNTEDAFKQVGEVLRSYRKEIGKAIRLIEEGKIVRKTENAYYIMAGKNISEHILSNATSIVCRSIFAELPVFAFAETEDGKVKVSARISDSMVSEGISINEIVSECAREVGGEGGGHPGAAGATIPMNSEDKFISFAEQKLNILKEGVDVKTGESGEYKKPSPKIKDKESSAEPVKSDGKKEDSKKREEVEGKGLVRYFSS
jgi:RecJ-like exonuclease